MFSNILRGLLYILYQFLTPVLIYRVDVESILDTTAIRLLLETAVTDERSIDIRYRSDIHLQIMTRGTSRRRMFNNKGVWDARKIGKPRAMSSIVITSSSLRPARGEMREVRGERRETKDERTRVVISPYGPRACGERVRAAPSRSPDSGRNDTLRPAACGSRRGRNGYLESTNLSSPCVKRVKRLARANLKLFCYRETGVGELNGPEIARRRFAKRSVRESRARQPIDSAEKRAERARFDLC